jgi:protein SCO1/2
MTTNRTLALALWAAVALVGGLATAWFFVIEPRMNQTVADTLGRGDYELVMTNGQTFTQETLESGPSAVFFGFTYCPDVCPTTLGDVLTWQEILNEEGEETLDVYFVTVDPERDTPELLEDYVSWAPGVIGVSGSREEIDKAIKAFRVYAKQVPLEGGDYTMDHSAFVLLFDKDGRFDQPIRYGEQTERAMTKIRNLIAG